MRGGVACDGSESYLRPMPRAVAPVAPSPCEAAHEPASYEHMFAWPRVALRSTPPLGRASAFAETVRRAVLGPRAADERLDERELCRRGGFLLEEATLHAAEGRLEALLLPHAGDRFRVVVDTEPRGGWARVAPERRAELHRHRLRFRVAHEVGHTLFYDRSGERPRPLVDPCSAQEAFCDEFARALLIPHAYAASLPPTAEAVVELHRRFDVSVELACRALARAHEGRAKVALAVTGDADGCSLQWSSHERDPRDRVAVLESIRRRVRRRASLAAGVTAVELSPRRQLVVVVA